MNLNEQLARETAPDRDYLVSAPIIQRCMAGDITRQQYVAFLTQAYHHVRHTVPLLIATGAGLPDRHRLAARSDPALPGGGDRSRAVDPERH